MVLSTKKGTNSGRKKSLAMKDITKKCHKIHKCVEQKQSNKSILAEWINSPTKELKNSYRENEPEPKVGGIYEGNQWNSLVKRMLL